MIPRKTYIPHIPAFVYLVVFFTPKYTAVGSFSWHYFPSNYLLCIIFYSAYTNLNINRIFSSTFQIFLQIFNKEILQADIFTAIFQHLLSFWKERSLHNVSRATDDGIIQFGDDVNIYTVYLSRAITTCGNCLNWLEKTIVSDHIFVNFL